MSSFWFVIKQQWTIEEISIFSNSSHLEWRTGLSDTILKWDPFNDHPCQVWCNLVQQFQRKRFKCDLLSKYIPNLHNQYKSAERKISQKNPEYMFQRRRFICESLRRTMDVKWWQKLTWPKAKAHMAFGQVS